MLAAVFLFTLALPKAILASPTQSFYHPKCKTLTGDLQVKQYQLYPENYDFDQDRCFAYFGGMYNTSLVVYNPYKKEVLDIVTFENLTLAGTNHVGGVRVDPPTGHMVIAVTPSHIFETLSANKAGGDAIIKYDLHARRELFRVNLTDVGHAQYWGYQDVVLDSHGYIYAMGTYPSTIVKIDPLGKEAKLWYVIQPANSSVYGFGSGAITRNILVANENTYGTLVRFDLDASEGTPETVVITPPTVVPHSDEVYFPPKYGGKVILVLLDMVGTAVFRSNDGQWHTAEYIGTIALTAEEMGSGWSVAAAEIGNSVYIVLEFFFDPPTTSWGAGNRTDFPLIDITSRLDALVGDCC